MRGKTTMLMALALGLVLSAGCRQPSPVTADVPPSTGGTPSAPAPAAGVEQASPEDPFTADLDTLNAHLRREGLLGPIYFDYDSAELSSEIRNRLLADARFLGDVALVEIAVQGLDLPILARVKESDVPPQGAEVGVGIDSGAVLVFEADNGERPAA